MRLSRYLIEIDQWTEYNEPRSKTITLEEAVDFAAKHCRDALKGTLIKRNVHGAWKEVLRFTDPKSGQPRVSRNTANYYTLIIDNSKRWKKFPKRSRSVICGIGRRVGAFYVFPEDGAKIGVCPSYDFWASFLKQNIYDMDTFNTTLEELACASINNCSRFDNDLSLVKSVFKQIDEVKISDPKEFKRKTKNVWIDSHRNWIKPYVDNPDMKLYDFIEKTLDPKKNGFKLVKVGAKLTGDIEVWTDGRCILVKEGYLDDFLSGIGL